jgi:uncharacterized membrane protein
LVQIKVYIVDLKELILAANAVFWGFLLLLPGNTFASRSGVDAMSRYAQDWAWGILFLTFGLLVLLVPKTGYLRVRRFSHAFFWVCWLSIYLIAILRSFSDGLHAVDLLITSPFLTLAFLHGAIYLRLRQLER